MAINFTDPAPKRHPRLPEHAKGSEAKAVLRKSERRLIGHAIDRMRQLAGLTLNGFAGAISTADRIFDDRQIARWIDGSEAAQLGAVLAVERFRPLLVQAFAEVAGEGVELTTQITIRRRV